MRQGGCRERSSTDDCRLALGRQCVYSKDSVDMRGAQVTSACDGMAWHLARYPGIEGKLLRSQRRVVRRRGSRTTWIRAAIRAGAVRTANPPECPDDRLRAPRRADRTIVCSAAERAAQPNPNGPQRNLCGLACPRGLPRGLPSVLQ